MASPSPSVVVSCQHHPGRPARTKASRLCVTCYHREWRRRPLVMCPAHPDRKAMRNYNVCAECAAPARQKKYARLQNDCLLRTRYGITVADRDALYAQQGGVCAICGVAAATDIDHCHATGRVRGMLCSLCNKGLGLFRDRPDVLRRAANYLADVSMN